MALWNERDSLEKSTTPFPTPSNGPDMIHIINQYATLRTLQPSPRSRLLVVVDRGEYHSRGWSQTRACESKSRSRGRDTLSLFRECVGRAGLWMNA